MWKEKLHYLILYLRHPLDRFNLEWEIGLTVSIMNMNMNIACCFHLTTDLILFGVDKLSTISIDMSTQQLLSEPKSNSQ